MNTPATINLRSVSATLRAAGVPSAKTAMNGRIKGMRDLVSSGYETCGTDFVGFTGKARAALVTYRLRAGLYGVRPEAVETARRHMATAHAALVAKGFVVERMNDFEVVVRPPAA